MNKKTLEPKDKLVDLEVTLDSDDMRKLEKIAQKKKLTVSSLMELWITQKVLSNNL